jgi:hypothetical protein
MQDPEVIVDQILRCLVKHQLAVVVADRPILNKLVSQVVQEVVDNLVILEEVEQQDKVMLVVMVVHITHHLEHILMKKVAEAELAVPVKREILARVKVAVEV